MENKPLSRHEKLLFVRMAAGNFAYFCFFSSQIAYHFGFYILLGIAAKGNIKYLAHFL